MGAAGAAGPSKEGNMMFWTIRLRLPRSPSPSSSLGRLAIFWRRGGGRNEVEGKYFYVATSCSIRAKQNQSGNASTQPTMVPCNCGPWLSLERGVRAKRTIVVWWEGQLAKGGSIYFQLLSERNMRCLPAQNEPYGLDQRVGHVKKESDIGAQRMVGVVGKEGVEVMGGMMENMLRV